MIKALNTAASGMRAQEEHVNVISNNIANVNTNGFKRERAEFEDLLYQTVRESGARSSASTQYNIPVQIGTGSKFAGISRDFKVGNPQITNNPFDLMINGDGFFGLLQDNGSVTFSRDGSFNVDAQGTLVNKNGLKLFPGITVPPNTNSVSINANGDVQAFVNGQVEPSSIGKIPLFAFVNPGGLTAIGGNQYKESIGSGPAQQIAAGEGEVGKIMQGALESSNVSIMNEMTDMIKAQRAYEMNSKIMGMADQMLQTVNNIR